MMKRRLILLAQIFSAIAVAQIKPSVTYDPQTGNYIIQYEGHEGDNEKSVLVREIYEPPTKINPAVNARIVNEPDSKSLQYSYKIYNNASSLQRLEDFDLVVTASIWQIASPNNYWKYSFYSFVPVFGWYSSMGQNGLADPNNGIAPDSSQAGFSFVSAGLPCVVNAYFRGNPTTVLSFPDEPPSEIYQLLEPLRKFPNDCVVRRTIGPTKPPSPFEPLNFVDTLLSYVRQCPSSGWITSQTITNKYTGYFNSARFSFEKGNFAAVRTTLAQVLADVNIDSTSNLTSEAYALIRYNTEYLLSQLPAAPPPGLAVRLINSTGSSLTGGSLQFYEGSWKDAVNNNDGTFNVNTTLTTVSLRMTYAYGSQTKSNVPVNGGPVTFQTVNTQVKLQNSQGGLIDQGTVQYYAGAWRDFGSTTNGIATKELLPASYSFRMTYAYGSNDKQQDIGSNPTVVFQTVNAAAQLQNSQGTLMDQGTVQYYAGAWRDFGSTSNGVVTKELLPNNYSFRMTYAFASKDKQQNIGTNPTVVFNTVNATVQLKNSLGNLIPAPLGDQGTVQYYAGAWRSFGTTTNGSAAKELLPNSYSFRMTYEYVSNDKTQDIGANSTVSYSTVLCTVRATNTLGQAVGGAQISYYSGAWRAIGATVSGQITKELLPANLSFRMSYAGKTQDKQQNLSTNSTVEFVTQ